MGGDHGLPFKVGQLAEARSFLPGYRGAWFRCKIKEICRRKKELGYILEYHDFPDEKIRWTKLFQKPQTGGRNSNEHKRELMVRPQFPSICPESQMPDVITNSEVVVVVNDVWKVGDLVDWWTDNCYWSGRLTKALGDEKFEIELHPPPVGEGGDPEDPYVASCKDLRPSLDWSPDGGWTLPISEDRENVRCCARLFKPVIQGESMNLTLQAVGDTQKDVQATAGASLEHNDSFSSRVSASSLLPQGKSECTPERPLGTADSKQALTPEINMGFDAEDKDIRKTNFAGSISSSHVRNASAELAGATAGERSSKKKRVDGSISLNTMSSDTTEVAILDLEELVNRVKWIKSILEFGKPLSDTARSSWKFLEHRPSSTPK